MKNLLKKNDVFKVEHNIMLVGFTLKADGVYVVTKTAMTGGGTGMGFHDVYPDGYEVTAVRVNPKTTETVGRPVAFYQNRIVFNLVEPKKIIKLGVAQVKFILPKGLK